jgi:hypothetical protein
MSKAVLQKLAGRASSFADLRPTPTEHFKLYFYAAVLRVIKQCFEIFGSREIAFEQFPFLAGYNLELAVRGVDEMTCAEASRCWYEALRDWRSGTASLDDRIARSLVAHTG